MRQVNLENVQESGNFNRLPAGGYVCRYTNVKDIQMNPQNGKGDYLQMEYDIAEGDYKDYYKNLETALHFWGGRYIRSYKEKALPMFKRMCSAVSKSNPGFVFDGGRQNADEKTLVGKYVGLVLGEEEYMGNDGNKKTRLYVHAEYDVADIRSGKYKVPELKKRKEESGSQGSGRETGFLEVPEGVQEEIPFC